jgi:hypothetical protein
MESGCPQGGRTMKIRTRFIVALSMVIAISFIVTSIILPQPIKESLTYFPIDPTLTFLTAESNLTLQDDKKQNEYNVEWQVYSETDRKVYLRQDVSLLFVDGILTDAMYQWIDNTSRQTQVKTIKGEDSSLYETISFHHAEIHLEENTIRSAQTMTKDKIYVIDSSFSPLQSFRKTSNKEQEEWKKIIDHVSSQHLQNSWNELLKHFQLNQKNYYAFTLLGLTDFNNKPLPGMSEEKTQEVIGQLWEGLYKNYLLGIKLSPTESISPVGSKVPLILISNDRSHLLILIEGKNGEKVKLVQQL